MEIAFLAGQNSIHTIRWANAMAQRLHRVHLITMHDPRDTINSSVQVHRLPFNAPHGYFLNVRTLKKVLKNINPDLLHIHYATGYGTLGSLCGFHPRVLSVWGSDVYDFPNQNSLNRALVAFNLRSSDWVCSTSKVMAIRTKSICSNIQNLSITPFGIDLNTFKCIPTFKDQNFITIGTVKTLTPKYGIDILIRAFAQVKSSLAQKLPEVSSRLRLLIIGDGFQRKELESLSHRLGVQHCTTFIGMIPHQEVPNYLNQMDIYVAVSRRDSESFGVAILEASACCLPVVVSDVGGLPEVVKNGVTGYIVSKENLDATAQAIVKLLEDASLRKKMGEAGRQLVLEQYEWNENVSRMEEVYHQVLNLKQ